MGKGSALDNHDANSKPLSEETDKYGPQPDSDYDDVDKNELGIKEEDADDDGTSNGEDKDSVYYTGSNDEYGDDGGSSRSGGSGDGSSSDDDDWGWGR